MDLENAPRGIVALTVVQIVRLTNLALTQLPRCELVKHDEIVSRRLGGT